jgi:hypothetical protein
MARGGRKRKMAERHQCGKVKQSRDLLAPFKVEGIEIRTVRDLESNREVTRYENLHVSVLAKLFCEGKVKREQLEAGGRFFELWERRRKLYLDAPSPNAKVASLQGGSFGHDNGEESDEQLRKARGINRSYREAIDAILDAPNGHVLAWAVRTVVCWDEEPVKHTLIAAQLGLDVLVKHFAVGK